MLNITLDVDRTNADARDEQTSIVRSTPATRRRRLVPLVAAGVHI